MTGDWSLIRHLDDGVADDLVADPEALLEDLGDDVLAELLVFHVHHGVVGIGVEGVAGLAKLLHAQARPNSFLHFL